MPGPRFTPIKIPRPVFMKPETLVRRATERFLARHAAKVERCRRLAELAERDGPDSIWAELLSIEGEITLSPTGATT